MEKIYVWGCIPDCFMLSSLPCFPAFCWSAIPTSCYYFIIYITRLNTYNVWNLMKTHVVSHWVYPQGGGCRDDRRGGGSPLQWCGPGVAGQHPRTDPYLQTEETRHLPSCGEIAVFFFFFFKLYVGYICTLSAVLIVCTVFLCTQLKVFAV